MTVPQRPNPSAVATPKAGDRVLVAHDCEGLGGATVRHDAPVLVTSVTECVVGTRVRGVRCDGSAIEWLAGEELGR